jgi:redox-sensitive bicupin YhaK (pirin superfamily)
VALHPISVLPRLLIYSTEALCIAHSERTPANARRGGDGLFGIQSWIALPEHSDEIAPTFQHFGAADLPVVEADGLWARVVAGSAFGEHSPVGMLSEWFYAGCTELDAPSNG